jgi:hypothetical protein
MEFTLALLQSARLEIRCDVVLSKQETEGYASIRDSGDVFAVGEFWFVEGNRDWLLIDRQSTDNAVVAIDSLRTIARQRRNVRPAFLSPGESLGEWLHGYWARIDEEKPLESDENNYELACGADWMDSRDGAAYVFVSDQTVEIELALPRENLYRLFLLRRDQLLRDTEAMIAKIRTDLRDAFGRV